MEILGCDFLVVGGPVLQCPVENMPSWHLSRLTFTNSTEQPVWTRPFVILLYTGGGGCFSFGGTVQYIEESNIYLCFVVCRLKRGLVT